MAEDFDNIEQQDPFSEFGGKAITTKKVETDPFAEFGGKTIQKKNPIGNASVDGTKGISPSKLQSQSTFQQGTDLASGAALGSIKPVKQPTQQKSDRFLEIGEPVQPSARVPQQRVVGSEPMDWFVASDKKGQLQGKVANILSMGKRPSTDELAQIANLQKEIQSMPQSDAEQAFAKDGFKIFKDPLLGAKFLGETIISSLSSLVESGKRTVPAAIGIGAGAGSVVPGVGTLAGAGTGLTAGLTAAGANLSTSQDILKSLSDNGVDITDKDSLVKAFSDEDKMAKIRSTALKYGIPIAMFDVASAGVAGKLIGGAAGKSIAKKMIAGLGEGGIQAVGGSAGELSGQLLSGKKVNWDDVALEGIASLATDAPDVAIGAIRERVKTASSNKNLAQQIVSQGKEAGVEDAIVNLNRDLANGTITEKEHNDGLQFIQKAVEVDEKIPPTVTGENRAKSIELIAERDRLENEIQEREALKEGLDKAYHAPLDEANAEVQIRIDEINKEVGKIASKPQPTSQEQPTLLEQDVKEAEESQPIPLQKEEKSQDITLQGEPIASTVKSEDSDVKFDFEYVEPEDVANTGKVKQKEILHSVGDIVKDKLQKIVGDEFIVTISKSKGTGSSYVTIFPKDESRDKYVRKNLEVRVSDHYPNRARNSSDAEQHIIIKNGINKIDLTEIAEKFYKTYNINRESTKTQIQQPTEVKQPIVEEVSEVKRPTKEEKTPTTEGLNRAEAKKIHQRVKEMEAPTDAEQIALRYLAEGGKVSEAAINEVAGTVKRARLNTGERELKSSEAKLRDYYEKNGQSLDELAHSLWEKSGQEVSERDIKDALMDAIGSYNNRLEASKAYLERYNTEYQEEQYYNRLAEERAEEHAKEELKIQEWLASKGEEELELAASEEHINQLIKQYETEFERENQQSEPTSESKTNKEVSSRTSGEESKIEQEYKEIKTIKKKLKFVEDNFESIVSQLMLKNKIKRIC